MSDKPIGREFSYDVVLADQNSKNAVAFSLEGPSSKPAAAPTPQQYSDSTTSDVQSWGPGNNDPKLWREKISKSTTALPLIFKSAQFLYGKGLSYYLVEYKGGKKVKTYKELKEVDDFLKANNISYFLLERLMDYKFFNNIFCEYITTGDRTKIALLNHLEAEFSRFSVPDEKTGKIAKIYYEGTWPEQKTNTSIPFLDTRDVVKNKQNKLPQARFATHSCFPVPGHTMYAIPSHYGLLIDDSWLDYTNSIPVILNSINKNVMDIRFHIRIPYEYWRNTYEDWSTITPETRKSRIDDKLEEMRGFLTGNKNAQKPFFSHYATDQVTGKPLAGWEIIEINGTDKKDKYNTTVQEGDTQTARALNTDPSMAGIQPAGGKMGAGSGSDKRVGFTNGIALTPAESVVVLEPLYYVKTLNGWADNLEFEFEYDIPTTLNNDPSGVIPKN